MNQNLIVLAKEKSQKSILLHFLNEIRDKKIQKDSLRFRVNLSRISQILGYEASKLFDYNPLIVQTPLGEYSSKQIKDQIVIANILRAGIPMHMALLEVFDFAENAFISAYRKYNKSGKFVINLDYISTPSLEGKTLVLADPMIATGASIVATLDQLKEFGTPSKIILLGIIASVEGIDYIRASSIVDTIIVADLDEELTGKGYIVPGLGDAGDLAFGMKI